MKETKYEAIKELPSTVECWNRHETISVGTICDVKNWNGSDTICYKDKMICDVDSEMAKKYFKKFA